MAIRHVRAVQEYSKIEDDLTRHVLEVIALDIGRDDSPAHTSNRKIARRVRSSVNTVRDKIVDAIASGELIASKDGKYIFYRLNYDMLPYGRTSGGSRAENDGKTADNPIATTADLAVLEERLYQRLYQENERLYQTLYQKIVSIVSAVQTDIDTEVRKVNREEERGIPPISAHDLALHFQSKTGLLPNNGSLLDDWIPVFDVWIDIYGINAPDMIDRAVDFARGKNKDEKRYTIASPRSLVNIMANLDKPNGSNGSLKRNSDGSYYG